MKEIFENRSGWRYDLVSNIPHQNASSFVLCFTVSCQRVFFESLVNTLLIVVGSIDVVDAGDQFVDRVNSRS
jgi:hypothetical protein